MMRAAGVVFDVPSSSVSYKVIEIEVALYNSIYSLDELIHIFSFRTFST